MEYNLKRHIILVICKNLPAISVGGILSAEGIVDGGVLLDVFAVVEAIIGSEAHGILIHGDNVLLPPEVQLVFVLVELVVVNIGGNVRVHCCTI